MRVLFIGKRFYTNRDAMAEKYGRIWQLPWHWSKMGISTRLWLVDYHTPKGATQLEGELQIISSPVRDASVLRQYFAQAKQMPRPDVVVASGDCYIGLMAYRLAGRLGSRFVFDVYDKYDEFGAYLRLPGFDLFRFLLRKSNANLFASRVLLEQVDTHSRCSVLVPNGIDTQRFFARDMEASRAAVGVPRDGTWVGYFGSLDEERGIDDLLAAQQLLQESGADIRLLIAGKTRPGLDLNRPGVLYLGNLEYEKVPSALACCDLLALPYRRSAYLDSASSCKIGEYIAMGRPIVATRTPNLIRNFPDEAAQLNLFLAEPGDPDDLARAIQAQSGAGQLVFPTSQRSWQNIACDAATELRFI